MSAVQNQDARRELRTVLLQPDAAMPPRYRAGEAVVFELAAVPQPGDDVMLVLHDGRTLVRELAAINAQSFELLEADGSSMALPVSEVRQALPVVGAVRRSAVAAGGAA